MTTTKIQKLNTLIEYAIKEDIPQHKKGNNVFWPQGDFYFKNEKRQATVTDVKYISENLVVVAHRAAAKLYLVQIKNDTFTLLDSLVLDTAQYSLSLRKRYNNQRFFHPDLIALYQNTIYMSEYTNRCCIVEVHNHKLVYKKIIDLGNNVFHGCFTDNTHAMFGSVKNGAITLLNHKTQKIHSIDTRLEPKQRIKTIGAQGNEVILSVDRLNGKHTEKGTTVDCWIKLYKNQGNELILLDTLTLPHVQVDGHKCYKNHHFITMHDGNKKSGVILIITTKHHKLQLIKKVFCESFPHGLDILNNKLLYTNYSKSSLIAHNLNELINIE